MSTRQSRAADEAWARVERDKQLDRFIKRVSIGAWSATFLIVLAFALLNGMQLVEMVRAVRQEGLPWTVVVESAIPLIVVLGFLSVLIATLSTIAVFLRLRTSSLTEIQLRLAALEEMLASAPDSERSSG